MSHVFEITEEDIRNGVRGDPARCPLAIAMTRHYGFKSCEVHNDLVKYTNADGEPHNAPLHPAVAAIVARYDEQGEMKPIKLVGQTYTFDINPEWYNYPATRP